MSSFISWLFFLLLSGKLIKLNKPFKDKDKVDLDADEVEDDEEFLSIA
jgi:hypothetical protein